MGSAHRMPLREPCFPAERRPYHRLIDSLPGAVLVGTQLAENPTRHGPKEGSWRVSEQWLHPNMTAQMPELSMPADTSANAYVI